MKITESQLRDRIASLEAKIDEFTMPSASSVGQTVGQVAGAPVAAANWVGQKVGQAVDAAKQGVQNFAQGVQQGYQQQTGGQQQAAATTGTTKPVAKPDPNVLKLQQDLIAKGAKIKADGIMGPATKAAQAQFGGQAAAPAGTTAPAAPTPAVPGQQAGGAVVDTRGGVQGQDEIEESVTFNNDELTRLVSLVQHR